MGRASLLCVGRREMHAKFYWGNLMETDHLEDLSIDETVM
jgi:hypothetical protein